MKGPILSFALLSVALSAARQGQGRICEVNRELYVASPSPGVSAVVSVTYMGPGLRRCEIHSDEAKSDLVEKIRVRYSEDNGRTWSVLEPMHKGTDALKQGKNSMEDLSFAVNYDPTSGKTIEMQFQRIFLGDPSAALGSYFRGGEQKFFDHGMYRLSSDEGRTWSVSRQLKYEDGPKFDPDNWADPGFLRTNQMYGGYDVTLLRDGRIAYPAVVPVVREDDEEDRKVCGKVPWFAGKGRVAGVLCFIGKWNREKGDYEWGCSKPVFVSRRISTRGLMEPVVAELRDGRLLLEMRGSNAHLDPVRFPGRKWISLSKDAGRTWSEVSDLRYDTGEQFYAPSTFARMIRSRKTGRLYWFGNISREPARGNDPRYPLYIAEVDENIPAIKKSTLTVIDDREPTDSARVQFSNFSLLENRETQELELYLTRYGEKEEKTFWANAYKYTLTLR